MNLKNIRDIFCKESTPLDADVPAEKAIPSEKTIATEKAVPEVPVVSEMPATQAMAEKDAPAAPDTFDRIGVDLEQQWKEEQEREATYPAVEFAIPSSATQLGTNSATASSRRAEFRMGSPVSTAKLQEEVDAAALAAQKEGKTLDTAVLPRGRFLDRELSWLAFNERVLEQAEDTDLAILERAWFLSIFASNLDEFYMVRVAGLKSRIEAGMATTKASGFPPRQVMEGINQRAQELMARHAALFRDCVQPKLAEVGIHILHWQDLGDEEKERLRKFYRKQIFPVLTPLAVDPAHPFPYISGLSLNLAVVVRNKQSGKELFARVKVPPLLPRFIAVDASGKPYRPEDVPADAKGRTYYIPLEEIIGVHLSTLFPGMEIVEYSTFRVTRNEDLEVEEDDAENLLKALEKELQKRKFGRVVRLEVAQNISKHVLSMLMREMEVREEDVFRLPEPLDLTGLEVIHELDRPQLKYKKFVPVTPKGFTEVETAQETDVFAAIRAHDILVQHPYDSFSTSVQRFIQQAAADPKVLAIKQTLYRTSGDSPIVDALIKAAEAGKQVLAVVEIKARFDEQNNIEWARKLEKAGVHVVYGIVGLKTHCKLCLVVRQEEGILRRYCHVGTGNYNPKTARGYEDLGYFTCERNVGQDLIRLFNQLSGYSPKTKFHRLLVAPLGIRKGLIELINTEIANKKAGKAAWIRIKTNSLVDERIIDALYRASQAGVPVEIQVRGICCLRAGITGLSENIKVRSVLGRFLEHSRIYGFANAGAPVVYMGSADLMHRNLDRRIEALISIEDPEMQKYLLELIEIACADTTQSWRLGPEGWRHVVYAEAGDEMQGEARGEMQGEARAEEDAKQRLVHVQDILMQRARARTAEK